MDSYSEDLMVYYFDESSSRAKKETRYCNSEYFRIFGYALLLPWYNNSVLLPLPKNAASFEVGHG